MKKQTNCWFCKKPLNSDKEGAKYCDFVCLENFKNASGYRARRKTKVYKDMLITNALRKKGYIK